MLTAYLRVCTIAAFSLLPFQVFAKEPDYTCYIRTHYGRTVNLTRSVCRFDVEKSSRTSRQDISFIAAIKETMDGLDEPWLSEVVGSNEGLFISAAREYCGTRQSGISDGQLMERKYQEIIAAQYASPSPSPQNPQEHNQRWREKQIKFVTWFLASALGPQHYCPELANRPER